MRLVLRVICLTALLGAAVCLAQQSQPESNTIRKLDSKLLPNLVAVGQRVYSGGQPDGEAAFEELRSRGIRTIISVDGARPNVEAAAKFGIRYVHLPHGYDGVPPERAKELAKALQTLEGPFYIHCHHGLHRSPAATAVACKSLGWLQPAEALKLLTTAGTDPRYRGLFQSVIEASTMTEAELQKVTADFPSVAQLPPMAELMVEIEQHYSGLQAAQRRRWQSNEHRTSVTQHAVLLVEQFRELRRIDDPRSRIVEFIKMSEASEEAALIIERELSSTSVDATESANKLDQAMRVIADNCKACHQLVRN